MKPYLKSILLILFIIVLPAFADNILTYQGQLAKSGSPYSGEAYFKFIMQTNGITVWTQDGSGLTPPTGVVTAQVSMGFYTVYLGDRSVTRDLPVALFNLAEMMSIRVWVATPGDGSFTQMTPDRPVTACAKAINAGAIGGVTVNELMRKWSNVVIVAKNGGDVTTIQAGINLAAGLPDRSVVWVCPGRYQEGIICAPNVDIIGMSREGVILDAVNTTAVLAVQIPQGSVRIQDMTIKTRGATPQTGIFCGNGVYLDRLTVCTEGTGIIITNEITYADDIRVRTERNGVQGITIHSSGVLQGTHLDISNIFESSDGILVIGGGVADLHDVRIITMERYSPGFTLMDMSDATVDSMQIETRGDSSPGILIAIAVMGGGWYNDIAIDTYGASADGAMAANGIFIHNSYPTIENFSINVHSPSNTAGVYVELSDYFPLFDDGTIRTYGFNCPGIYSVGSRPMFFHVNIAIEGWSSEDNWGPYPLPGPGCGLVSETQVGMSISEPYLNNCIIMMGNASPSAYASGGSPVHMTPANMKLYNCTCLDRVSGGPRWMGYSLDMDPGFPPGACILWAAHNRLKSPGGSGLGYPLFPAPDITMFSMAIMGAMDPQGNIPDFMF